MSQQLEQRLFWLILALYLLLAVGYGLVNPLFEAPDEHWHYFTAQYVADNGRLPTVTDQYDEWLSQQAAQPPLYYLLSSLIVRPIDTSQAREQVWLNPFAAIGDASKTTNLNRMVHGPWEDWPWQGYALAAHLLRLLSTLMGLGTLLFVAASARLLWPERPERALLAMALLAVWPQFLFLHASVTNDALITLLASAGIYQLLWLWQHEASPWRLLLLGLTIGLAALSKNAGVLLLIYSLGVLGWLAWRNGRFHLIPQAILYVLLPALLLAGWLWWRNWLLYADPLATEPFIRIAGGDRGYTLWQVLLESDGLWRSLFAIFGWFNVRPPDWVHWIWSGMAVVAIVNVGRSAYCVVRRNTLTDYAIRTTILLGWLLMVYAGLVTFMLRTEAAQGRLLFPAIVSLVLGLAYGLSRLPRWLAGLTPLLGLTTAVYCLFFVIQPTYAQPPLLDQLPGEATRIDADVGQGLTLIGAQVETETAVPGQFVWFTLYWQLSDPVEERPETPEFVLELLGRDLERVGNLHSYHGRGLFPATLWPTGKIVADRFAIVVDETAVAPVLAIPFVGLATAGPRVHAGEVKLVPHAWPEAAGPPLAQLGDTILLTDVGIVEKTAVFQPGDTITIQVQWQVTQPPGTDYTTLIHLAEAGQPPLATGDNQPLAGQYPTRVWASGEVIDDHYELIIPAGLANGRYPLWLGMYDSDTLTRLPLTINQERQPHDTYLIGWLEVSRD
jgi:4-amino-4-deoxy-L-arabinose transferase-like glycosyltransferase